MPYPLTILTPPQERAFQAWKAKYAPLDSGQDYDLRGAFLSGFVPDPSNDYHFPDLHKLPNHPTFSTESKYHSKETPGGTWEKLPSGKYNFHASPHNLKSYSPAALQAYFDKEEPNNTLILPRGWNQSMSNPNALPPPPITPSPFKP